LDILVVLLFEREKKPRERLKTALEEAGYEVRAVVDARAFLAALEEGPPHAVIMDLDLPGGEGMDLLRGVRVSSPDIPVIVETAEPTVEQAVEVIKRGAYNYVSKTSPASTVVDILSHALERERMEVESRERARERKIRTFDDPASLAVIDGILAKHHYSGSMLISYLQDIQKELNYLPQEALRFVARRVNVPLPRVYGIATFYKSFSLKPRGEHMIQVCLGTACHVKGGTNIVERFERELGIKTGDTTYDDRFSLESVRCVGCCGLAPVFVIDGQFFGKMTQEKIPEVLGRYD
jgi:NADH-quinone oxidoreductase subunit E